MEYLFKGIVTLTNFLFDVYRRLASKLGLAAATEESAVSRYQRLFLATLRA